MSWTNDPPVLLASVIVPVWNAVGTIDGCLQALLNQTASAEDYEVIVVDDGSTDGSGEFAAEHGVKVIRQEHRGAAAARNRGVQDAQGQFLLFTDADCTPLPDWVDQMLGPFADLEVMAVKGVYRTRQASLVARFAQAEFEEKYHRLARQPQIDFVDTYAAAYRRRVFEEQGGFDPDFLLDEDQELSFRLARAGHKLVFAPQAAVYHHHPETVWTYFRRKAKLARWKIRVHARHPGKAIRDSYTPWTQRAQIVLLPLSLATLVLAVLGWISWSLAIVPTVLGFFSTLPLATRAVRQGWSVVLLTPLFALLRALTLDLGLAWGFLHHFVHRAD